MLSVFFNGGLPKDFPESVMTIATFHENVQKLGKTNFRSLATNVESLNRKFVMQVWFSARYILCLLHSQKVGVDWVESSYDVID